MTGCTVRRYEQFETFPETIEQELRPAVCERQKQRLKENNSIDIKLQCPFVFSTRPSDRLQIWHAYADSSGNHSNLNKVDPPHLRGLRGDVRG